MKFTDTHIHLYSEDFAPDLKDLIQNATAAGVERFFMPNIDSSTMEGMLNLEKEYSGKCFPMMGLHPTSVKENWKDELAIVERELSLRRYAAVGEMGMDLYWDKTFIEEQKKAFSRQVEIANEYGLPIVIHTRDSFEETYELLQKVKKKTPCGIFHCFTGNSEQAKRVIDMGFYLGIGGVATFKNGGLDKVLTEISLDHIVLETDGPYLAPVPFRGKRNEPAYIIKIAERVAEIMNCSLVELSESTERNVNKVFSVKGEIN